ncbi:hypothetical protein [Nocardioides sp. MH1]|uniref:hypothetical protein n=1 Tax=Nocardioides sp. MH1 TaxID=3242490 RepID=UPI00352192FF
MRRWLARITLLLGVLLVVGAGWYGATSLLDDDDPATGSDPPPACSPTSEHLARLAQRAFARRYADERWVSGYGVRELDGKGSVVFVTTTRKAPLDDLPGCVQDVPVVYTPAG